MSRSKTGLDLGNLTTNNVDFRVSLFFFFPSPMTVRKKEITDFRIPDFGGLIIIWRRFVILYVYYSVMVPP